MTDKTLGAYTRHESPDYADGGVTAALIEQEAEEPTAEVRELRSALARELARSNALQDALDAAESRPLTPDAITDEMVGRGYDALMSTTKVGVPFVRELLTAALTEPPTRPEGAEEIEALLAASWPIDREGLSAAADDLAMNGVRVVSEDGEDR